MKRGRPPRNSEAMDARVRKQEERKRAAQDTREGWEWMRSETLRDIESLDGYPAELQSLVRDVKKIMWLYDVNYRWPGETAPPAELRREFMPMEEQRIKWVCKWGKWLDAFPHNDAKLLATPMDVLEKLEKRRRGIS
jgi:hypothetical protein